AVAQLRLVRSMRVIITPFQHLLNRGLLRLQRSSEVARFEGIILAAGASSRAGSFKMELPLGDKTLIERSIEGMYNVCSRIIVVAGFRIERVRELLSHYSKVEVVENRNWQRGMFSSVQCGVRHLDAERFFLLPADVPLVPESVYLKLLSAENNIVVPKYCGRNGHPIVLHRSIVRIILSEPETSNLRRLIQECGFKSVPVEHKDILVDVDSPEDIGVVRMRFSNRIVENRRAAHH
ncbi:MAG: nucleotidyltransferase family protein, partial [bacterium]